MNYKVIEYNLKDKEGNVLEKKYEVKKRFLKWFWKPICSNLPTLKEASKRIEAEQKIDAKNKCMWECCEVEIPTEYKTNVMAKRKPRGNK